MPGKSRPRKDPLSRRDLQRSRAAKVAGTKPQSAQAGYGTMIGTINSIFTQGEVDNAHQCVFFAIGRVCGRSICH